MSDDEKHQQVEQMWAEHEASDAALWDYYRKAYRCESWPADLVRYFRNDPIADWKEFRR